MTMTTALIIGSHGFSAGHLCRRLERMDDVRIVGADIQSDPPAGAREYAVVDIRRRDQVEDTIKKWRPDWVFNLVGLTGGDPEDIYRVNFLGGTYLLEAVRVHAPDARVLLVGSAAEYGTVDPEDLPITEDQPCRPVGHYGVSKHALTLAGLSYARQYGMKVVVARPFNIIGAGIPGSLVLGAILRRLREALAGPGEPVVKVGNLDTARDFVDVENVVDAYVKMVRGSGWGEVFNICSGQPVPVRWLVELALSFAPRPVTIEVDPALVRPADVPVLYGSWEKACKAFGFKPVTSLEESVCAAWGSVVAG